MVSWSLPCKYASKCIFSQEYMGKVKPTSCPSSSLARRMGGGNTLETTHSVQQGSCEFADQGSSPRYIQLICGLLSSITTSPAVIMNSKRWKGRSIAQPGHQHGHSVSTQLTRRAQRPPSIFGHYPKQCP